MNKIIVSPSEHDYLNESEFNNLADYFLNKCYLVINGTKWRLIEIEFYLYNKNHSDPYVHCDNDQLLNNTFYFHRFKNGTYKSGTFKGMDITLGCSKIGAYFGILIRSIQRVSTGEVIEGPCNTVNKILSKFGFTKITELTGNKNLNIFDKKQKLYLKPTNSLIKQTIYYGPRIGLSDKYLEWRDKYYRYVVHKNMIKKKKTSLVEVKN
ncbi:hypothetical protein [Powai lake megavirus]|uniref:Uncharacterized protein n=1 Tax=Powai lake megavirus TaxID=1842663 RepID=A0A167R3Z7_9VIRU|nr:hypothetical protein QJ849_gp122 [Powai lake megavirus]ANB50284.1 hypothetical protein [Powai lake megavirus]